MKSLILAFLLLAAPAMGQESSSVGIPYTMMKDISTRGNFTVMMSPPQIANVSRDGDVTINWKQADKTVANPADTDPMTLAIARLMVAIRDGTWKPIQEDTK